MWPAKEALFWTSQAFHFHILDIDILILSSPHVIPQIYKSEGNVSHRGAA